MAKEEIKAAVQLVLIAEQVIHTQIEEGILPHLTGDELLNAITDEYIRLDNELNI